MLSNSIFMFDLYFMKKESNSKIQNKASIKSKYDFQCINIDVEQNNLHNIVKLKLTKREKRIPNDHLNVSTLNTWRSFDVQSQKGEHLCQDSHNLHAYSWKFPYPPILMLNF